MTTPRGFRDRNDDSLLTLIGEIPELIRNLVIAEVDAAKAWVRRTSKDAGIGTGWIAAPCSSCSGRSAPCWRSRSSDSRRGGPPGLGLAGVLVVILLIAAVFALLGVLRFRKVAKAQNPVQSIVQDVKEVRDEL